MIWREHYKENSFDYRFEEKGSGIGGSDANMEIKWFMNKTFRLATLRDWEKDAETLIIDFTRYDLKAEEPESGSTRNWSLFNVINQKQIRPQDQPVPFSALSEENRNIIKNSKVNLE